MRARGLDRRHDARGQLVAKRELFLVSFLGGGIVILVAVQFSVCFGMHTGRRLFFALEYVNVE